ncbi:hypothetical protein P3X46_016447 [Hevea brasiliensis]|uniref:Ribosomal protein L34Ae n=1 Tax=Hevea brasiliensis TaxID=3981 RepID=A0ABQ9LZ79_HEVBR|nr:uncharacterized protein LOC110659520 isoform X2 [Hevea brasiliensis]KAJ9173296.1 hypothetical protein P3X46_016447 [Hevea brasiliensis]
MGTHNNFLLNSHFLFLSMGSVYVFLYQKLILFADSFWFSVSALFLALFGFFNRTIFRVKANDSSQTNNSNCLELNSNCVEQEAEAKGPGLESNCMEQESEAKEPEVYITEFINKKENADLEEEETPKFFFKFQFQSYREDYEPVVSGFVSSSSTNKYEFLSGKDSRLYMEKPEAFNVTVKELYTDSNDGSTGNREIIEKTILPSEKFEEQKSEAESIHEERKESSVDSARKEGLTQKLEAEAYVEGSISGKGIAVDVEKEHNAWSDQHVSRDDGRFLSERDFIDPDSHSDSDSITSSHEIINRFVASTSESFLSDIDFEDAFELDILGDIEGEKAELAEEDLELEDINLQNLSAGYEPDGFEDEDSDILEELKNLEVSNMQNSGNLEPEKLSEEKDVEEQAELGCNDKEPEDGLDNSEDSNGLETLWEHQELIEQLKMELKKVRATGLPTILEEDESPKIMEDLKPWKIDEKFQHEDRMGELHKLYKSYRERMRKFDILNYQKMYALGFLQSKDPLKSISSHKASGPALTSLVSQKFLLGKRKKSSSDPMMSFIRELHSDLEMVYVGQMCLSWEILHWQYEKVLEICDSDPYGMRQYNEVAGEFQQFQVLMQRFIENERFEGPRVQNYVKNRCDLRNLLQVPVVREDGLKDKMARRKVKVDDAITSDKLVEIMEESIRIFWQFIRADKDAHNVILKCRRGTQIEPLEPTELQLLTEVRASLQKKEKKLKDILRSGNCILRKFQKHQEDSSEQVLYFFSQVDMKLVSRVLNMSKITTDQLIWCGNKLDKINFVSRRIHVEPSFLLFPC